MVSVEVLPFKMNYLSLVLFMCVAAGAVPSELPTSCDQLQCSHTCEEKREWISVCTCPKNMFLDADKNTCREPTSILLAMFKGIKMFKEGKDSELQPVLPLRTSAFDVHFANKEIYAFADNNILRYSFNEDLSRPSAPVAILPVDTKVTSLAVDWIGGRLYWVCEQRSVLESATTDGTQRKTITTSSPDQEFKDVVVDPIAGKIFWLGSTKIYSADLSGNNVNFTLTVPELIPDRLALDTVNQLIFVISSNSKTKELSVVTYHYDGSVAGKPFVIGQGKSEVFGFGVVGNQLFWHSNYNGENLYKCVVPEKGGSANVSLVEEIDQVVYAMKIFHPDLQKSLKT